MITFSLALFIITVAAVTFLFTRWFISYAHSVQITDVPNSRSSHTKPTPTGGGVGFVAVSMAAVLIYAYQTGVTENSSFITFVSILVIMALIGWMDDKNELSRKLRYGAQSAAAIAVIIFISNIDTFHLPYLGMMDLGLIGFVFAFIWITGTPNLYNFMDGVDGIASMQAIGASAGWMYLASSWQIPELLILNLFIFISVTVFLWFNWAPASIFMGDVGSLFLGFLFAIMPFYAAYLPGSPEIGILIWVAAIMLWPFLFDGAYTLFRRAKMGENILEPHRSHLYQRLYELNWPHHKISLLYGIFILITVFCALLYVTIPEGARLTILLFLLSGSFAFARYVKKLEDRL